MGALTPLGNSVEETWEGMKNGRSGIGKIEGCDDSALSIHIAGEVRGYDPAPHFKKDPKSVRRCDRFEQLTMGAVAEALENSGLDLDTVDKTRVGVMIGSGIGGLGIHGDGCAALIKSGPRRVSPFCIPYMITNMASGMVSIEYGFGGPNMSISTACATANHCIGEAWRIMKFGDADVMICGGAEAAVLPVGIAGFANMKALSTRNDDPTGASRPFSKSRDGFVMGEGGACLVLEEYEHAVARGAKIYAELAGTGLSSDAYHMTAPLPNGEGAAKVMEYALNEAGMAPEEVDYINTHGTSTYAGDIAEVSAIKSVFGEHAYKLNISSTKSMTGHLLGGAGALEAVLTVLTVKEDIVPPTINHAEGDEDEKIDYNLNFTFNTAQKRVVNAAISNTFGFGGHNTSIVFKKMK